MTVPAFPGDELFDDDENAFRLEFREWLARHPAPSRPRTVDRTWMDTYSAWQQSLAEAGYGALHWPPEYGGAGRPIGHQLAQIEELAKTGTDAKVLMAGLYLIAPVLMSIGTPEQKEHLPEILMGRERWALLLSEPGAGSDLFSLQTKGVTDGDTIRLSGQKIWTSFGHVADYSMALVRTDAEGKRSRGLSLVIVDMTAPGITIRPIRQMNGAAEFNEVFLEDVPARRADVVGELHQGAASLFLLLSAERTGLGLAGYASLVQKVEQLRAEVARSGDAHLRRRWVEMWARVAAQRLNALRGAANLSRPDGSFAPASLAKLQNATNAQALAELALHARGTAALTLDADEHVVSAFLRSPADSIGGGTSEIQKNAIAEKILELPR
jgi:alkylation response protein AidB-like acyl-CoA dehydrogenase